jgi:SAM-dependent methyltransferase
VPAERVLEIGPGFGRWTQHLLALAGQLTVVDLTDRCIEHCRGRFGSVPGFEAWTNDGESLAMIPDGSVDFVFSFDSLVHAEAPVLRAYLVQLARKLKPGGTGFIHHSNLLALAGADGAIPRWVVRRNWRGESMSAALFRQYCREAGLVCVSQEIINWVSRSRRADRHRIPGPGMPLTDAMSRFQKPRHAAATPTPTLVYVNPHFVEEWRQMIDLAAIYGCSECTATSTDGRAPAAASRAARVLRAEGLGGVANRLKERVTSAADHMASLGRERLVARTVRRREPVMNALDNGLCPDCRSPLTGRRHCHHCDVDFIS